MDRLIEFDTVRIVQIHGPPEAHLAADLEPPEKAASRQLPRIGDTGTIVHLISADGRTDGHPHDLGTRYFVERVTPDGRTEWLAEFSRGELELVVPAA